MQNNKNITDLSCFQDELNTITAESWVIFDME